MPADAVAASTPRTKPARYAPRPLDLARRFACAEAPVPYPLERSLRQADGLALALRAALERISIPLARACSAFASSGAWVRFGFARLEDHARERFRRSGRWVRDLSALDAALARQPRLLQALTGDDGGRPIGRVAALLLGRCASAESLDAWLTLARSSTVRDLREAVRRARLAGSEWPLSEGERPGADAPSERVASADTEPGGDPLADPERVLVRLSVPAPLLGAFDEAVELYRAVEGREATVTSFIEALLAEASAGNLPLGGGAFPDCDPIRLRASERRAAVETALARSTGNWRHLESTPRASWALALAGTSLGRLEALARMAGSGGPADLDRQIRSLAALEDEIEARLGRLLAEMAERGAWARLRFAGVGHYAEERLGLSRTGGEDRARLARALRPFPILRDAYERGCIGASVAGLLARLLAGAPADRDLERDWLVRAQEATLKRMRDEARALGRAGLEDRPGGAGPGDPSRRPGRADRVPRPLPDDAWHASLHRTVGTATRRLERWGALLVASDDRPLPGPDAFLRLRLPEDLAGRFLSTVEAARAALARRGEQAAWDEPLPESPARPSVLAARTFSTRSRRVPAWTGLLWLLEDFVATWDVEQAGMRRPGQEIYAREGWRCAAPGCTSRRHLEDHHLTYRSRGGGDAPANRTCLCRFHHQRGEHGGLARCRGTAPLGVVWRLGAPALATWFRNERRLAAPAGAPAGAASPADRVNTFGGRVS